ncbi:hypothetical protein T03_1642 [Trichinella britovi]|uniref:Uncharacterized protein n=1 Tax=Trichinella britovi TaxID=45882 RepID=A0A0V1AH45_TRIBR|nr:hypothetical protein T03_1642 [Trichinella britovi]
MSLVSRVSMSLPIARISNSWLLISSCNRSSSFRLWLDAGCNSKRRLMWASKISAVSKLKSFAG